MLPKMSSERLYYSLALKQKLACRQEVTETEQQGINLMLVKQTFIIGRITTIPCLFAKQQSELRTLKATY